MNKLFPILIILILFVACTPKDNSGGLGIIKLSGLNWNLRNSEIEKLLPSGGITKDQWFMDIWETNVQWRNARIYNIPCDIIFYSEDILEFTLGMVEVDFKCNESEKYIYFEKLNQRLDSIYGNGRDFKMEVKGKAKRWQLNNETLELLYVDNRADDSEEDIGPASLGIRIQKNKK